MVRRCLNSKFVNTRPPGPAISLRSETFTLFPIPTTMVITSFACGTKVNTILDENNHGNVEGHNGHPVLP